MNKFKQTFEKDLNLFYNATNIPICVFDNMQHDILRCPVIPSMNCSPQTLKKCAGLLNTKTQKPHLPIFISSYLCFLAILKLDADTNVMFGPISSVSLSYREFFHAHKQRSTPEDLAHLYLIIQQSPHMNPSQFANCISLYIKLVFQEDISVKEILTNHIQIDTKDICAATAATTETHFITGKRALAFENKVLFHIQNGHINEIKKIIDNKMFFTAYENLPSTIEELQREFFIYATLCYKAVLDEGLDSKNAFALFDRYLALVPAMTDLSDFESMCAGISIDYCKQMDDFLHKNTDSLVVSQCMQYIEDNLYTRITVDDLARHCNVSKRTITRHFSEYYHMPAADYILQLKLKEATFWLINSTISIVEISNKLAFSSQSHFSVAFKKRYHYSPQQYRDKYKK